jgi:hypothetical protein
MMVRQVANIKLFNTFRFHNRSTQIATSKIAKTRYIENVLTN